MSEKITEIEKGTKGPVAVTSPEVISLDNSQADTDGEFGSEQTAITRWFRRTRTKEQKLVTKLDFFILSWACFSYFLRLLDTSNMTNAYVSGMKEDLALNGDQFNYFNTFWTIGYTIGMIPSQVITTHIRPSLWIPAAEVIWAILTFCFAAVNDAKQVYAMRFLIGLAESPFYVGAMTLLGNWYTPTELATRAGLFYSASFAANMFSGYLQAAVYKGLNDAHGLAGWRWLFIICGVITVPGSLWGFFAVPDSPYTTRVFYLKPEEIELAKSRMVQVGRKPFSGVSLRTFYSALARPWVWLFVVNYIFFCLNTYPLAFFALYVKSLGVFSVEKINVIPTSAHAAGLVFTIFWCILSDKTRNRTWVAFAITCVNIVSCSVLAAAPSRAAVFFGYISNATTFAYGPVMITFLNETFTEFADERALILGVAQALGAAFSAWVPLLIFNTGRQGPLFRLGFILAASFGGLQALGVLGLAWLGRKIVKGSVVA